jgi:hypothetical protein
MPKIAETLSILIPASGARCRRSIRNMLSSRMRKTRDSDSPRVIITKPRRLRYLLPVIVSSVTIVATLANGIGAEPAKQDSAWRLIRSADPRGGADAVAVMRTADVLKSDVGLAGLMFRCGDHGLEVVVVATMPFEPRAQPHLKLRAGKTETEFSATVVPPFSALLLPKEAVALFGEWQSASELLIEIEDQQMVIRGAVPLAGLKSATAMLRANCPIR